MHPTSFDELPSYLAERSRAFRIFQQSTDRHDRIIKFLSNEEEVLYEIRSRPISGEWRRDHFEPDVGRTEPWLLQERQPLLKGASYRNYTYL